MRGYSQVIVNKNLLAPLSSDGVKLGRFCIERGISANYLANYFGVSRPTIYAWFSGEKAPRPTQIRKIRDFIQQAGD